MVDFQLIVYFAVIFRKMLVSKGMEEGAKKAQRTHKEGSDFFVRQLMFRQHRAGQCLPVGKFFYQPILCFHLIMSLPIPIIPMGITCSVSTSPSVAGLAPVASSAATVSGSTATLGTSSSTPSVPSVRLTPLRTAISHTASAVPPCITATSNSVCPCPTLIRQPDLADVRLRSARSGFVIQTH